jgi:hypothetical protein
MLKKGLKFDLPNELGNCLLIFLLGATEEIDFPDDLQRSYKSRFFMSNLTKKYLTRYTSPNLPLPSNLSLVNSYILCCCSNGLPLGLWHLVELVSLSLGMSGWISLRVATFLLILRKLCFSSVDLVYISMTDLSTLPLSVVSYFLWVGGWMKLKLLLWSLTLS